MLLSSDANKILEHFIKHGNLDDCYQYDRHKKELYEVYPELTIELEKIREAKEEAKMILERIQDDHSEY